MSKLVDKERLTKLAKALDARAKAAVAAEKERALAAEQAIEAKADANAAAIATINNTENGLLAQAKSHAQGLVDGEKSRAEKEEGLLSGRLDTLEGIIGGNAEGALGEVIADVAENAAAIAKLNGKADEEGSVAKAVADAVKVEKDRAEDVEAGFETRIADNEKFVAAQPAIDAEQNRRLGILEGLVVGGEGEGLDKVIADVAAAQTAAKNAQDAADAAQADVDAVEQRLDAKGGLVDRIKAVETFRDTTYPAAEAKVREDFAAADTELHTTISDEIDADVLVETNRATAREAELDAAIKAEAQTARAAEKANKAVIDKLNGTVDVEGSVKKQIKDAIDEVNGAAETLAGRVQANETKLAGLEKDTVQAAIDQAEKDAKDYADQKITALVDSAPDAMNTLNELAKAINDNKDVYDAYIEEHAEAMAQQKADLQAEIDADVKVVADELTKQKDAEQEGTLANQIKVEKARAEGQEAAIRTAFAAADTALQGNIDKKVDQTAYNTKVQELAAEDSRIAGLVASEAKTARAAEEALQESIDLKVNQSAYNTKVQALEKADTDLGTRIAAFETGGAQDVAAKETRLAAAESDIEALQAFMNGHSHEALQQAIQAEVKEGGARDAAIKAAIDKEVLDRNSAIADELKAYSDTTAVKAMLSNVINSLGLAIKDDKLQLTLGTDDYVIKEVKLEMATDADINEIIAGLDAK